MTQSGPSTSSDKLSALLQVEWDIRQADDEDSLGFIAVNECQRLIDYDYAVLWRAPVRAVTAISGVSSIEANAPMVTWCNHLVAHLMQGDGAQYPGVLDRDSLPESLQQGWGEWSQGGILWRPMSLKRGTINAGLLLFRRRAWSDGELYIVSRLASALGQSFALLDAHKGRNLKTLLGAVRTKPVVSAVAVGVLLALFIPVRTTVLAPAQVSAQTPYVVSAPIDGVIDDFLVRPNVPVQKGTPLFRFVETGLKARKDIAEKALALAQAELEVARKRAFGDGKTKGDVAVLTARVAEKEVEYAHAAEQFAWIDVIAPAAGIAIFDDANDWRGRPVRVGEKILTVADAADAALTIDLPVDDATVIEVGARVVFYLNTRPLDPIEARLERAGYLPSPQPDGTVSYRLKAGFDPSNTPPRIGLKGTAKLYGQKVSLFYFLMRRPLAALRRLSGL